MVDARVIYVGIFLVRFRAFGDFLTYEECPRFLCVFL